jgi:hypothetical protein
MNDMVSIRKIQPLSVVKVRGSRADLGGGVLSAGAVADFFREGKQVV